MPSRHDVPGRTFGWKSSAVSAVQFVSSHRLRYSLLLTIVTLAAALLPGFALAADPPPIEYVPIGSEDVAKIARQYVGAAYRYGGVGPRAFDCSGLTKFVFGQVGVELPHNAASQYNSRGTRIKSIADLAPGDLVFFVRTTGGRGITHAAIYVGDGRMVSANTPRTGVQLNSIHESYWASRFAGGLRVHR